MFLYSEKAGEAAPVLFREVLHHLWDLGFQVGHSMRTIHECIELAGQDLSIRTAMMTSRFFGRKLVSVPAVSSPIFPTGGRPWDAAFCRAEDGRAAP